MSTCKAEDRCMFMVSKQHIWVATITFDEPRGMQRCAAVVLDLSQCEEYGL